jgi:glycosyltransferase involved in cell wall biosynthesis
MAKTDVTVVIPSLNYGHWLGRAISSVRAQTLPVEEIIVVDGGSVDGSVAVANSLGARVLYAPARGQADARNQGIAATDSKFIVPLDADDWIEPDYVESCLEVMQPGVGVAAPGLVWPDGRVQWPLPPFTRSSFLEGNLLFTCSMFRRVCWVAAGGYDTGATYEDWDLWFSILEQGWKIEMVHKPLFHYMAHGDSSTTRMRPGQHEAYVHYIREKHRV